MNCKVCGVIMPVLSKCHGTHVTYNHDYKPHTPRDCAAELRRRLELAEPVVEASGVYERILLTCGMLPRAQTVLKEEREMRAAIASQESP